MEKERGHSSGSTFEGRLEPERSRTDRQTEGGKEVHLTGAETRRWDRVTGVKGKECGSRCGHIMQSLESHTSGFSLPSKRRCESTGGCEEGCDVVRCAETVCFAVN